METIAAGLALIIAAIVGIFVARKTGEAKGKADATDAIAKEQAEATINTTKEVQDAVETSRAPDADGAVPGWHDRLQSSRRDQ